MASSISVSYTHLGQRDFDKLVVGAKDEFERIFANRKNVVDFNTMDRDDE